MSAQVSDTERAALIALYEATNGAQWSDSTGWLGAAGTECSWYGVECWDGPNVRALTLSDNSLMGELPAELADLTELRYIDMWYNQLSGSIPSELGSLSSLRELGLGGNQLSGTIPAELGNLVNLDGLYLEENELEGVIPDELGQLTQLVYLALYANQLEGTIPATLGNLTALQGMWLTENQFEGTIPPELGNLVNLRSLGLADAQLSGTIPGQLSSLGVLQELDLSGNQLTGSIPAELGDLINLTGLWLGNNQLAGTIPAGLGDLGSLESLSLGSNQLTGSIPGELAGLGSLREIDLSDNQLTGSIPAELGQLGDLHGLWASGNQLSGTIPSELGNLSGLTELDLSGNQLTGQLDPWLAGLTQLQALWLEGNQLSGNVPPLIGDLANLQYLGLGYNQLTGSIPADVGDLTALVELDLGGNRLGGTLPPQLGNLQNLRALWVGENQLTGSIPAELGSLDRLEALYLGGNQLSGTIPDSISDLVALQGLDLSVNQLQGTIPQGLAGLVHLRQLYLGENRLTGTLPDLGGLIELVDLFAGANQLTGTIPDGIGNLSELVYLGLYGNQLSGTIPDSLGNLTEMRGLWLGGNQLSGSIPEELGNLESLRELYLDFNQLTGTIPRQLGNLTDLEQFSLYGNHISGAIPSELGELENLIYLWLADNQLSGGIPSSLGQLGNLLELALRSNRLTGSIPTTLSNLDNLEDGWGIDLRWNALFTTDPALRAFLDSKQDEGDWESTQTVAPTEVAVVAVDTDAVELEWTPITYSWDPGGYEVQAGTSAGGPYQVLARTEDKGVSSLAANGLEPGTTYYFVVRTVTDPHGANQNTVESALSEEVSATTRAATDCSLSCTATVPTQAEVDETVSFGATASASNCDGEVGFSWTFGDGTSSTQQNPGHSYGSVGTYGWQLTAEIEDQRCTDSGTITVFGAGSECGNGTCEAGETAWTCPSDCGLDAEQTGRAGEGSTRSAVPAAVGGVGGVGGTYWVSEAMIHNPGADAATFTLHFVPDATPGQAISAGPLSLEGGAAEFYSNFVEELFDVSDNGSVRIESDEPLMLVSRTFNDTPDGTYGQFLGAVSTSRALGIGDVGYVIGLREDDAFRSNLILQEVAGTSTQVEVGVYTGDGALEGEATITVPAHTKVQGRLLSLGFSDLSDAYAAITVLTGGQVIAIGSVVDQITGDAMTMDAVHPDQVELVQTASMKGHASSLRLSVEDGAPNGCTAKTLQAVDFTWSPTYPTVGETVQFTDLSTDTIRSWLWSFGDGGQSSEQHPSHTYTEAGTYTVSLAASTSLFSRTFRTKTLTVGEVPGIMAHYLLAVVARLPGAEGTQWRSDVWVMNPFAEAQQVRLEYRPVDGSGSQAELLLVRSGEQLALGDVIAELFSAAGDGKGGLHVYGPQGVVISSRTYNLGQAGTFGQAIPALAGGDLLAPGDTGRLLKLKSTTTTRCNLGFTEFDGSDTSVRVRLFAPGDQGLTLLAEGTYQVSAYENYQVNRIFEILGVSGEIDEALAFVEVVSGGRVYAYASNVDSRTGDAEFIPAMKN